MPTTYSGFLIHSNLRAYIDRNGRLDPMFVTTEFKTIEEVHARIDRYWQEWDQWQSRHHVNYAQAIKILTDDTDRSDEARDQEADRFEEKVNEYYEREHYFGNE